MLTSQVVQNLNLLGTVEKKRFSKVVPNLNHVVCELALQADSVEL